MSQFDFGTIDPYVVDGVELADFLNQWRDALLSLHRGGTRPTYVVPGMLWINDSAGPNAWVLQWYVSPTVGDVALFTLNTTTGAVTVSASAGGSFAAATLLAQAAASPSVQWNATGNPIDVKNWRMTVNGAGALVLASYNDAGVVQQSITFNRDGSITTPNPPVQWRRLGRVVPTAGQTSVDFTSLPSDINDLEFRFDVTPQTTSVGFNLQFFDSGGTIIATGYSGAAILTSAASALGSAPFNYPVSASTAMAFNYGNAGQLVTNTVGIRGSGRVNNIRDAARFKYVDWQSGYSSDGGSYSSMVGTYQRGTNGSITGLRFQFSAGNYAAGGAIALWGSP